MNTPLSKLTFKKFVILYWDLILPTKFRFSVVISFLLFINYFFIYNLFITLSFSILYNLILNMIILSQNILLIMIAIIVTGYSLVQSLLTRDHAILLSKIENNKYSYFTKFNFYFYSLGLTYIIMVLFNLIFLIFFSNKDVMIYFIKNFKFLQNKLIIISFFNIYLFIMILFLLDMKSFLKNLYDNFKISTTLMITNAPTINATKNKK